MDGYQTNSDCILDYVTLFQLLSEEQPNEEQCKQMRKNILARETATPPAVTLAPSYLQQRFANHNPLHVLMQLLIRLHHLPTLLKEYVFS